MGTGDVRSAVLTYFQGEKLGALWALGLGTVALLATLWLWQSGGARRGAAYPLGLIGLVELALGITLLVRTGPQVERLVETLAQAPAQLRTTEVPRMERVQRSFQIIKAVELVLIVTGVGLALGLRQRQPLWAAVGAGLLLQASTLLVFDLFAERRGATYLGALQTGLPPPPA